MMSLSAWKCSVLPFSKVSLETSRQAILPKHLNRSRPWMRLLCSVWFWSASSWCTTKLSVTSLRIPSSLVSSLLLDRLSSQVNQQHRIEKASSINILSKSIQLFEFQKKTTVTTSHEKIETRRDQYFLWDFMTSKWLMKGKVINGFCMPILLMEISWCLRLLECFEFKNKLSGNINCNSVHETANKREDPLQQCFTWKKFLGIFHRNVHNVPGLRELSWLKEN